MSTFKVTVERISKVYVHPNADKLQLAQVSGMTFQFCVEKDKYVAGDSVVYFPVDSLIPKPLIDFLNIEKFLSGKDKNRIKTVALRGQISQGFVVRLNILTDYILTVDPVRWNEIAITSLQQVNDPQDLFTGMDLTDTLGVKKYDPPEIPCHDGILVRHPPGIGHYDIEGCDRHPNVVALLLPQKVMVQEKMEGSNHVSSILSDDTIVVGQRDYHIRPIEGIVHNWWKAAEHAGHFDILKEIKRELNAQQVSIRSELCGPKMRENIYNFSHHMLFTFDILVDRTYLNPKEYIEMCAKYKLMIPPVIAMDVVLQDWLGTKTLQEASHGFATVTQKDGILREGIVIKPMIEQNCNELGGRLFLKQRDPIYLEKTGN